MTKDSIQSRMGWPPVDMPPGGGDPQSVMLCTLEVSFSSRSLRFYYSSIVRFERNGMTIIGAIDAALSNPPTIPIDMRPMSTSSTAYRNSTLSLNNYTHDYVAFVLGSTSTNLEFTEERPFSKVYDRDREDIFFDATYVSDRRAYFIANNTKSTAGQSYWFNIHLNINGPNRTTIPMILDPDIGHPGGNGGKG